MSSFDKLNKLYKPQLEKKTIIKAVDRFRPGKVLFF